MNKSKTTRLGKFLIMFLVVMLITIPVFATTGDRTTETSDDSQSVETATIEVFETLESSDAESLLVSDETSDEETIVASEEETEESVGESIEQTSSIEFVGDAIEEPTVEPEYDFSDVPLSQSTIDAIVESCNEYEVPIPVALAIINTESNFIDGLWSDANCYGLMGLHASYFPNIYTPEDNVRSGIEFLGGLIAEHGNLYVALNVYANGHYTGNLSHQYYVMEYAYEWSAKTGAPLTVTL